MKPDYYFEIKNLRYYVVIEPKVLFYPFPAGRDLLYPSIEGLIYVNEHGEGYKELLNYHEKYIHNKKFSQTLEDIINDK